MRFVVRFLVPLAATFLVVVVAHANIARMGEAHVSFNASGPAGMTISGTTSELEVVETEQEIVVTVPLRNLDTKIDLRNKHMREKYLEVAKYPNAELRVLKVAIDAGAGKAVGKLTLHGRSKPIAFSYSRKTEGGAIAVTGAFRVNMDEYGIEKPGYAGISVKPDVDVNVAFNVKQD